MDWHAAVSSTYQSPPYRQGTSSASKAGRALDVIDDVINTIEWKEPAQTAVFNKEEFGNAVIELRRLITEASP